MSLIDEVLGALDPANSYILKYLNGMQDMDKAAVATSLIPGVGDVMGAAADVSSMVKNPEERNLTNLLWLAAGAVPFVPSRSQAGAFSVPVESLRPLLSKELVGTPSRSAGPILINRDGTITDGNHRYWEALERGDSEIDVYFDPAESSSTRMTVKESIESAPEYNANIKPPIKAYHGSPHDFDKFSMDAIGTGEGAQAYGHGLYFAESEDVARGYRDGLTPKGEIIYKGDSIGRGELNAVNAGGRTAAENFALRQLFDSKGDVESAKSILLSQAKDPNWERAYIKAAEMLDGVAANSRIPQGAMYEVNINASPDEFLDWDKPPSDDLVRKIAEQSVANGIFDGTVDEAVDLMSEFGADMSGRQLLQGLSEQMQGDRQAANFLAEQGIKGIRYKDGFSRGADGGTSNYVVFDDSIIEIAKKYGLPPVLVAYALQRQQADEEI